MTILFFIAFFRHGAGLILKSSLASAHTFSLHTNIPWEQTSKLYSGRVSCYILINYEEEL